MGGSGEEREIVGIVVKLHTFALHSKYSWTLSCVHPSGVPVQRSRRLYSLSAYETRRALILL